MGREIRSVYRGELGFKIADAVRAEISEQDGQSKKSKISILPNAHSVPRRALGRLWNGYAQDWLVERSIYGCPKDWGATKVAGPPDHRAVGNGQSDTVRGHGNRFMHKYIVKAMNAHNSSRRPQPGETRLCTRKENGLNV